MSKTGQLQVVQEFRQLLYRQHEALEEGNLEEFLALLQEAESLRSRLKGLQENMEGLTSASDKDVIEETEPERDLETVAILLAECLRVHNEIVEMAYQQKGKLQADLAQLLEARRLAEAYGLKVQVIPRCLDRRE